MVAVVVVGEMAAKMLLRIQNCSLALPFKGFAFEQEKFAFYIAGICMTKTAIIHMVAVVVVGEMAAKMLLKIQIKLQPWQVRVAHRYVGISPVDS